MLLFPCHFFTSRIHRQAYFRVFQTKFTIYQLAFHADTKLLSRINSVICNGPGRKKSFIHIEHHAGAVSRECLVQEKIAVLTLLPSMWVQALAPSYLLQRQPERVFTLHQSMAQNLSVMRRSIFEISDAHLHSGTENLAEITKSGTIFVATQKLSGTVRTYRDGYKNRQKPISFKRNNHPARASNFFVLLCLPIRWIESTWCPYKPLESSLIHRKSERSVLALKIGPFRWVKYSPIFESNLVPLARANTWVQSTAADLDPRAEMGPVWTGIAFWWGCFGLNFAQMASGGVQSDFGLQGWIGPSRLKQIFLIFSVSRL